MVARGSSSPQLVPPFLEEQPFKKERGSGEVMDPGDLGVAVAAKVAGTVPLFGGQVLTGIPSQAYVPRTFTLMGFQPRLEGAGWAAAGGGGSSSWGGSVGPKVASSGEASVGAGTRAEAGTGAGTGAQTGLVPLAVGVKGMTKVGAGAGRGTGGGDGGGGGGDDSVGGCRVRHGDPRGKLAMPMATQIMTENQAALTAATLLDRVAAGGSNNLDTQALKQAMHVHVDIQRSMLDTRIKQAALDG
ncbi:unnamed protein product, partial [Discosporangium mesarthrocarpum]